MTSPLVVTATQYWDVPGLGTTKKFVDQRTGVTGGDHVTPYAYSRKRHKAYNYMSNMWTGQNHAPSCTWDTGNGKYPLSAPELQPVKNRAYSRLIDHLHGEKSNLGTFAAEWRESFGTIAKRVTDLRNGYRHLRRGDFRRFLESFSCESKRKHRGKVRATANEASGLWLEYWFAWAPSVADVTNACIQLSEPLPPVDSVSKGSSDFLQRRTPVGGWGSFWDVKLRVRVTAGGTFVLTNPNLFLANQLGLVNLPLTAYEVAPFSFLADWAFDIGSFLSSFSDLVGVEVVRPYWNCKRVHQFQYYHYYFDRGNPCRISHHDFDRVAALLQPLPNFQIRANLGRTLTRAASAASLLIQVTKT